MKLNTGKSAKKIRRERNHFDQQALEWLHNQGLKITPLRQAVLVTFLGSQGVLGLEDLQQALSKCLPKVDRVSLYRTLRLFEELHWIHKVADGRFMFCRHHCEQHAHWMLSCDSCGQVRELTDHRVIEALKPWLKKLGFSERHNGLIAGVCESCAPDSRQSRGLGYSF